jgi:periplasmic protein TonB
MVARWSPPLRPLPRLDRATALGLAVAGNALLLVLLSLPRDSGPLLQPRLAPPDVPLVVDIVRRPVQPVAQPLPPVPPPPQRVVERRPTPPMPAPVAVSGSPVALPPADPVEVAGPGLAVEVAEPVAAGGFIAISVLNDPPPPYPPLAIRRGAEGTVVLRVQVGSDGGVVDVRIERSSGHRDLDRAAERQVRERWRFVPAQVEGRPVEAWARLPVVFRLDG